MRRWGTRFGWLVLMVAVVVGLAGVGRAAAEDPSEDAKPPRDQLAEDAVGYHVEPGPRCAFRCEGGFSSPALRRLRSWMSGAFSSAAQAKNNSEDYIDIRLHMVPIWTWREDAYWLYVEQAVADHQEKPYRQRVYRLRQLDEDLFESRVFTFEEPLQHAGAWGQEHPLAELGPEDLSERVGCAILLRWTGGTFAGSTLGRLCESTLRGASFATSEVVITPGQLVSWDRGFDDAGQQVWGAEKGGYEFVKEESR